MKTIRKNMLIISSLLFVTNIAYAQLEDQNGSIMIGQGQAEGKLHIRSDGSFDNPQFYMDDWGGKKGLRIWQEPVHDRHVHFELFTCDICNGDMIFGVQNLSGTIQFRTGQSNTYQTRMSINRWGNVIIGEPQSINNTYRLNVGGKVRANEIVINTTGADYIFDPNYNLKSLPELEAFIVKNGHLPDISTAEEMQKEGMEVGELTTKLLAKIEELTLYLIQQDKEVRELREKVKEMDTINDK